MSTTRLSPLDASFLAVESPTAHMHVGWAATFSPPDGRPRPTFEELFEHVRGRLSRDARYRQRLAPTPLRLNAPLWIDDDAFDAEQHIVPASSATLSEAVDDCMSRQLDRDRPLWQLCIADRLEDGRIGVVGKAHHCMVDGIAAVELAALLLDPTPEPMPSEEDGWRPAPVPDALSRLSRGVLDQVRADLGLLRLPARALRSPAYALRLAENGARAARAGLGMLRPATPVRPVNAPLSPFRHLAGAQLPLSDLQRIKNRVRHDRQRRDARGRRRRGAAPFPAARRAARAPEGDGAGQRPIRGGRRVGQPDLVHVREPALRRTGPGAEAAVHQPGDRPGASGTAKRTGRERRSTRWATSPS